jgi:hypothetical protein
MKKLLLIVLPLLLIVGCSKTETNYYPNGQMKYKRETIGSVSGGSRRVNHGKTVEWYSNGQKKEEGNFTSDGLYSGLRTGSWTWWYENGNKKVFGYYGEYSASPSNFGQKVGLWTFWYENGNKRMEGYYDWYRKGTWTFWEKNGKKIGEGIYKTIGEIDYPGESQYSNTKFDGIFLEDISDRPPFNTISKKISIYKKVKLIQEQCWDEDGNEEECD